MFISVHFYAVISWFQAFAFKFNVYRYTTGRTRELLLAKNAREASREKATLKQHCDALEEKIASLESTTHTYTVGAPVRVDSP